MVIGLVFLIALVVVLATTVMLRKDLIHEDSLQLAGKYKDRFDATFVGSETCKKCHERILSGVEDFSYIHRMMRDVKARTAGRISAILTTPSDVRTFNKEDDGFCPWQPMEAAVYLKKEGG